MATMRYYKMQYKVMSSIFQSVLQKLAENISFQMDSELQRMKIKEVGRK